MQLNVWRSLTILHVCPILGFAHIVLIFLVTVSAKCIGYFICLFNFGLLMIQVIQILIVWLWTFRAWPNVDDIHFCFAWEMSRPNESSPRQEEIASQPPPSERKIISRTTIVYGANHKMQTKQRIRAPEKWIYSEHNHTIQMKTKAIKHIPFFLKFSICGWLAASFFSFISHACCSYCCGSGLHSSANNFTIHAHSAVINDFRLDIFFSLRLLWFRYIPKRAVDDIIDAVWII